MTLYSDETSLAWKFTDGIEFSFPEDVPVTIPAGGYVLVVRHPAAFSWRYPDVPVENARRRSKQVFQRVHRWTLERKANMQGNDSAGQVRIAATFETGGLHHALQRFLVRVHANGFSEVLVAFGVVCHELAECR